MPTWPPRGPSALQVHLAPGRTVVALALVVFAVIWVLVNGPFEGPTLVVVTPDHGLTVADLLSLVAFAVAAVVLLTGRR